MTLLFEGWLPESGSLSVLPLEFQAIDAAVEPQEAAPREEEVPRELLQKRVEELKTCLEEEQRSSAIAIERARGEMEEKRQQVWAEADSAIAALQSQVKAALESFSEERRRYFFEIEREVVLLSLSIAEHVLHREVAMDPLLLRSAARVALEGVALDDQVTLRVPGGRADAWKEALAEEYGKGSLQITEDAKLADGAAALVTTAGKIDLGVREQLKEIEHGFFDLLQKRPVR